MAARKSTRPGGSPAGRGGSIFYAFAPWIVFDVVASPSTWGYAALAGLITAVVLSGPSIARGQIKLLDLVAIIFFAGISLVALVVGRKDLLWLETYAQVLSSAVIAVAAFVSLAFDPFTAQYARDSAPREVWGTPEFRRVNRMLTLLWATVFAVIALLGLLALHVRSGSDWLNWILPIALIVVAVKITSRQGGLRRT
ncbi:hypothetical protein ACFVXW_34295 [Streptomyces sp. NPDC058251]|uniref:hypothetical protein n=1 Tax=unclassified Streptomyces TaxID=2593676 RepID=UPI00364F46CA